MWKFLWLGYSHCSFNYETDVRCSYALLLELSVSQKRSTLNIIGLKINNSIQSLCVCTPVLYIGNCVPVRSVEIHLCLEGWLHCSPLDQKSKQSSQYYHAQIRSTAPLAVQQSQYQQSTNLISSCYRQVAGFPFPHPTITQASVLPRTLRCKDIFPFLAALSSDEPL